MSKYKILYEMDDEYRVVDADEFEEKDYNGTSTLFAGSLADCVAWVQATEAGYM